MITNQAITHKTPVKENVAVNNYPQEQPPAKARTMKRSVLIVEDHDDTREVLSHTLIREGYQVATVTSGEEALAVAEAGTPDLLLLDLLLPGLDGLTVCRKLRAIPQTAGMGIVMLTAKDEEGDIVAGLDMGANDYMTKPFSHNVLLARVRAVLRNIPVHGEPEATEDPEAEIRVHDVTIHPGRHLVQVAERRVELSATEFRIVTFLARKPGWVFTREQILEAVHGDNYAITDRALDVCIAKLRAKLHRAGEYIETVRGVGYRFRE